MMPVPIIAAVVTACATGPCRSVCNVVSVVSHGKVPVVAASTRTGHAIVSTPYAPTIHTARPRTQFVIVFTPFTALTSSSRTSRRGGVWFSSFSRRQLEARARVIAVHPHQFRHAPAPRRARDESDQVDGCGDQCRLRRDTSFLH